MVLEATGSDGDSGGRKKGPNNSELPNSCSLVPLLSLIASYGGTRVITAKQASEQGYPLD